MSYMPAHDDAMLFDTGSRLGVPPSFGTNSQAVMFACYVNKTGTRKLLAVSRIKGRCSPDGSTSRCRQRTKSARLRKSRSQREPRALASRNACKELRAAEAAVRILGRNGAGDKPQRHPDKAGFVCLLPAGRMIAAAVRE